MSVCAATDQEPTFPTKAKTDLPAAAVSGRQDRMADTARPTHHAVEDAVCVEITIRLIMSNLVTSAATKSAMKPTTIITHTTPVVNQVFVDSIQRRHWSDRHLHRPGPTDEAGGGRGRRRRLQMCGEHAQSEDAHGTDQGTSHSVII